VDPGAGRRRSRALLSAQSISGTSAQVIFDAFADAVSLAVFLVDDIHGTDLDAAALLANCEAAGHTCSAVDPTDTYVALAGEVARDDLIRSDPLLDQAAQDAAKAEASPMDIASYVYAFGLILELEYTQEVRPGETLAETAAEAEMFVEAKVAKVASELDLGVLFLTINSVFQPFPPRSAPPPSPPALSTPQTPPPPPSQLALPPPSPLPSASTFPLPPPLLLIPPPPPTPPTAPHSPSLLSPSGSPLLAASADQSLTPIAVGVAVTPLALGLVACALLLLLIRRRKRRKKRATVGPVEPKIASTNAKEPAEGQGVGAYAVKPELLALGSILYTQEVADAGLQEDSEGDLSRLSRRSYRKPTVQPLFEAQAQHLSGHRFAVTDEVSLAKVWMPYNRAARGRGLQLFELDVDHHGVAAAQIVAVAKGHFARKEAARTRVKRDVERAAEHELISKPLTSVTRLAVADDYHAPPAPPLFLNPRAVPLCPSSPPPPPQSPEDLTDPVAEAFHLPFSEQPSAHRTAPKPAVAALAARLQRATARIDAHLHGSAADLNRSARYLAPPMTERAGPNSAIRELVRDAERVETAASVMDRPAPESREPPLSLAPPPDEEGVFHRKMPAPPPAARKRPPPS